MIMLLLNLNINITNLKAKLHLVTKSYLRIFLGKIIKYDSQLDFKCKSKLKLESNAQLT